MGRKAAKFVKKATGFSLLELMVVVAILGVLATVAVPRFNIFRARARQAEAKSNLGVIFTLQEAFSIDNETYYDGNNANWGGTQMNDNGSRDGYRGGGAGSCLPNKLGFRLANCGNARYGYWIANAGEVQFLAIAHATSEPQGNKRIFPGCAGSTASGVTTYVPNTGPSSAQMCERTYATTARGAPSDSGDSWCTDEARNLYNFRDITEHCSN